MKKNVLFVLKDDQSYNTIRVPRVMPKESKEIRKEWSEDAHISGRGYWNKKSKKC